MLLAATLVMTSRRRDGRQPHVALLDEVHSQPRNGHQCYHGTRRYFSLPNDANHVSDPKQPRLHLSQHKHAGTGTERASTSLSRCVFVAHEHATHPALWPTGTHLAARWATGPERFWPSSQNQPVPAAGESGVVRTEPA
jgi:hypothetical protein